MTARFDEPHDEQMASLLQALETAPDVHAPADFAARVMARVPATSRRRTARVIAPRYGRISALIALPTLIVAMLLVKGTTSNPSMSAALQLLLVAQLCAYTVWFGLASWRRN